MIRHILRSPERRVVGIKKWSAAILAAVRGRPGRAQ
jgi:hypothetical protein